jgi:hypothetical protein
MTPPKTTTKTPTKQLLGPWILLVFSTLICPFFSGCAGGGSGDSAPDGVGNNPPPLFDGVITLPPGVAPSPFAGNYDVAYLGDQQGSCAVQIFIDGSVNGRCVNNNGRTELLQGSVTPMGAFLSTLGSVASGGEFKGTLTRQNGSGSWQTTLGSIGTWVLNLPPVSAVLPDIAKPQADSTWLVGNGLEGIWRNSLDEPLVLTGDNALYFSPLDPNADTLRGTFSSPTSSSFQLNPDAVAIAPTSFGSVTGEASFTKRATLGFAYQRSTGGPLGDYTARFDPLNALAVAPADLVGAWSSSQAPDFTIGSNGELQVRTVAGVLGDCILNGTITPVSPNTHKNLFNVSLLASPIAPSTPAAPPPVCNALLGAPYTGYAFVRTVNVGNSAKPFYKQNLQVLASQGSAGVLVLSPNRR